MKILVTRKILPSGMKMLADFSSDVIVNPYDRSLNPEEIVDMAQGCHGILSLLSDSVTEEIMDAAGTQLKVISNYAVGYNNIDVKAASERKIFVTNTPGVLTDATADLTWALLMATARRIAEGDTYCRAGRFQGWAPELMLGADISGQTLGIIGFGRIGQAVAKRAAGFNMKILVHTSVIPEKKADFPEVDFCSAERIFSEADFISLHVPLTPETKYLITEREFRKMKKTAILINTARGPVVNESHLVTALENGFIAGAGLDVFENEPAIHPGLIKNPKAIIAPHVGSATYSTRSKMSEMCAASLIAALEGEVPPFCVNLSEF